VTRTEHSPIIVFDGVCGLCSRVVQFLIRRDKQALFYFASLQSEIGQQLLGDVGLSSPSMDSAVLIENNQAFTRSLAVLRIAYRLGPPWSLFYILRVIPEPVRDKAYDFVAAHRYGWFGQFESCMLPTAEQRSRFL